MESSARGTKQSGEFRETNRRRELQETKQNGE
uniref:Uncharacterized protein n=1 Tax=Arundo donax TaxID=35708 RepID=A0A0A8ZKU4_ARUDO